MPAFRKLAMCCVGAALTVLVSGLVWDSSLSFVSQKVIVPYGQHGNGWFTGLAITNVNTVNPTGIVYVNFYASDGTFMKSSEVGSIAPGAQYVGSVEEIYGGTPSAERFWMLVTHFGTEELAVTQFVWNSDKSFDFQSFNSKFYSTQQFWFPEEYRPIEWPPETPDYISNR